MPSYIISTLFDFFIHYTPYGYISLSKSRGNVATPYLFHVALRTFTGKITATYIQLSQASSNHVIEYWASSVYRYSQSFSTVKGKQITVPRVELTAIT